MATISSAGLGSGLDVSSIVSQLMAIEKQPLTKMQQAASKIDTKISAYGQVQSYASSLRDAAAKLAKAATWGTTTASSADATTVSASSSSTSAQTGTYSVTVSKLAASQAVASSAFTDKTATVGSGTLKLQLGSWDASGTAFTAKSGSSEVSVSVAATDTLADIRDKINATGAGVTATIVSDASGARLVMRSNDTGAANGFRVQASDDDLSDTDASGLSRLAYVSASGTNGTSRTQAASDAQATINGLSVTSSSNTLTDVVEGLTLKLNKVNASPVDVSVASDSETLKTALTDFAKAYNSLATYLTNQTKYDSSTKTAATFQGDSAMNALRSGLRAFASGNAGSSSTFKRLAEIGFDPQADGTLKTNSSKLDAALNNTAELKKMFVTTSGTDGLGASIRSWADGLLGVDGAVTTRQNSLQGQKTANTKAQDRLNERLTQVETRLKAQYTALDSTMSKISGMSNYVTQQLAAMANSSS